MDRQYNVYFSGELLPGQELAAVRRRLGLLFKAEQATLDRLFSGQPQLLKKHCDKPTALKYKQAMERAGARPLIRRSQTSKNPSTAQRIAAIAAQPAADKPKRETVQDSTGLSLAAAGSDVLKPEEGQTREPVDVDCSALSLSADFERLSPVPPPAPAAPDTEHLSLGPVGETIPTLPRYTQTLSPNTDSLNLAPEGSDFSDCATASPAAPAVDLSKFEISPAGEDLLEAQYRDRDKPKPPDSSQLTLES